MNEWNENRNANENSTKKTKKKMQRKMQWKMLKYAPSKKLVLSWMKIFMKTKTNAIYLDKRAM